MHLQRAVRRELYKTVETLSTLVPPKHKDRAETLLAEMREKLAVEQRQPRAMSEAHRQAIAASFERKRQTEVFEISRSDPDMRKEIIGQDNLEKALGRRMTSLRVMFSVHKNVIKMPVHGVTLTVRKTGRFADYLSTDCSIKDLLEA